MNNRKVGRFAVTVITSVLSAISGYAVSKYIDCKKNDGIIKKDKDIITDHTKSDIHKAWEIYVMIFIDHMKLRSEFITEWG